MSHWLAEPLVQVSSPDGGDPVDDALWSGISRFAMYRLGELDVDQPIQGAIGE
jgi:hypothetical protein